MIPETSWYYDMHGYRSGCLPYRAENAEHFMELRKSKKYVALFYSNQNWKGQAISKIKIYTCSNKEFNIHVNNDSTERKIYEKFIEFKNNNNLCSIYRDDPDYYFGYITFNSTFGDPKINDFMDKIDVAFQLPQRISQEIRAICNEVQLNRL